MKIISAVLRSMPHSTHPMIMPISSGPGIDEPGLGLEAFDGDPDIIGPAVVVVVVVPVVVVVIGSVVVDGGGIVVGAKIILNKIVNMDPPLSTFMTFP